jgi:hypothetical protein
MGKEIPMRKQFVAGDNFSGLDSFLLENIPAGRYINIILTTAKGRVHNRRVAVLHTKRLMIMREGSRKYGVVFDADWLRRWDITEVKVSLPERDQGKIWRKSWEEVLARLKASGLWEEVASNVALALSIGYDKIREAYTAYETLGYTDTISPIGIDTIRAIEPRLLDSDSIITDILWHMHQPARVKKMYWGKYDNDRKMSNIKWALESKTKIALDGRTSYDVSYQYNPEKAKAWYSEEYRSCGNGHYYLALDATHALFYEDD